MLSRGLLDALALWPVVAWPIVFSSAWWGFLRLCLASRASHGFSPLDRGSAAFLPAWAFLVAGAIFEAAVHATLLWLIGAPYLLVAIAIFILGWTLLPALLDGFGPALALLPPVHLFFAVAFLVLLGFADIGFLRTINEQLYGLLTGVPVKL